MEIKAQLCKVYLLVLMKTVYKVERKHIPQSRKQMEVMMEFVWKQGHQRLLEYLSKGENVMS